MTPNEFKKKMEGIRKRWGADTREILHCEADEMVAKILTELGYQEGAKIYNELPKWYGR